MFRRRVFTHHHIGESRLAPVYGRQLNSKPLGNTNCRPKTGSELPCGNATFRRKVAHLVPSPIIRNTTQTVHCGS
ncbi:MAG: hypothetical protein LBI18_11405 [Planctomycetaceae bacterium]|nr:hypothetical protein [Planctomycetaceae bacterium]